MLGRRKLNGFHPPPLTHKLDIAVDECLGYMYSYCTPGHLPLIVFELWRPGIF